MMGERYGTRPSAFLAIEDEWAALDFDTAVFVISAEERARAIEENKNNQSNKEYEHSLKQLPGVFEKR